MIKHKRSRLRLHLHHRYSHIWISHGLLHRNTPGPAVCIHDRLTLILSGNCSCTVYMPLQPKEELYLWTVTDVFGPVRVVQRGQRLFLALHSWRNGGDDARLSTAAQAVTQQASQLGVTVGHMRGLLNQGCNDSPKRQQGLVDQTCLLSTSIHCTRSVWHMSSEGHAQTEMTTHGATIRRCTIGWDSLIRPAIV